jgi:hypothetical protein
LAGEGSIIREARVLTLKIFVEEVRSYFKIDPSPGAPWPGRQDDKGKNASARGGQAEWQKRLMSIICARSEIISAWREIISLASLDNKTVTRVTVLFFIVYRR